MVIVDAYMKGIRNYDVEKAYALCRQSSLGPDTMRTGWQDFNERGYVSASVSATLENCHADACLALFSEALGKTEDAQMFRERAQNYRKLFDPEVGLMRPKDENGEFHPWVGATNMGGGSGCIESNSLQQSFSVPHDTEGLVALMGPDRYLETLTGLFENTPEGSNWNDYYNHPNEPVHTLPFLFNKIGKPWLTQKWSRWAAKSFYGTGIFGLNGNEDVGQMSAWYVLAAIGLHPLLSYAIKGAIWYQGESNAKTLASAQHYRVQLDRMIRSWRTQLAYAVGVRSGRTQWGQDIPFYAVQLPNFKSAQVLAVESENVWPAIRESFVHVAQHAPATFTCTTIDLGEAGNIHPRNKQGVGHRLASTILNTRYGKATPTTQLMKSFTVDGNKGVIAFEYSGSGLMAKGGVLKGFAIAGADQNFVWADAIIETRGGVECVVVASEAIPTPVAVRYAWADNPDTANLYRKEGFPASPFRIDSCDLQQAAAAKSAKKALLNSDPERFLQYMPDGIHPVREGALQIITPTILKALGLTQGKPEQSRASPCWDYVFRMMDKEVQRDRSVTREEYDLFWTKGFTKLDADANGVLMPDEYAPTVLFNHIDTDDDGKVTLKEYLTIYAPHFYKRDKNTDGTLDDTEM